MSIELIAAGLNGPLAGLNWKAIGLIITLVTTILGAGLGFGIKLIVGNLATHRELFEEKVERLGDRYAAAVDQNAALDKERMNRVLHDISSNKRKIEHVNEEFRKLLQQLPVDYVHRDDWVRGFSQLDGKIDRFAQKTDARLEAIYELISNTRETLAGQTKETKNGR